MRINSPYGTHAGGSVERKPLFGGVYVGGLGISGLSGVFPALSDFVSNAAEARESFSLGVDMSTPKMITRTHLSVDQLEGERRKDCLY